MSDCVTRYLSAFNAGDIEGMLVQLTDDVEHHVNQGEMRAGKELFRSFCRRMQMCYREELTDIVLFYNGDRAAAEYVVNGTYLENDIKMPEARGQSYRLPAGSFFALREGKIARVSTYYNLADWIRQVS